MMNDKLTTQIRQNFKIQRRIDASILMLIKRVEEEKIYLSHYPTLFEYMRKEFGLSDSQAQRRLAALGGIRKNPVLGKAVEDGEITVTQACLLGALQNQSDLPNKKELMVELVEDLKHKTAQETEEKARASFHLPPRKKKIIFELTEAQEAKWQRVKDIKKYDRDKIFDEFLNYMIQKEEDKKLTVRKTAQASRSPSPALRQHLLQKAKFRCEASSLNGRCSNRINLQIDHVKPWAVGGKTELSNLRVLCQQHNLRRVQTFS